jgi:hypothetical protein
MLLSILDPNLEIASSSWQLLSTGCAPLYRRICDGVRCVTSLRAMTFRPVEDIATSLIATIY